MVCGFAVMQYPVCSHNQLFKIACTEDCEDFCEPQDVLLVTQSSFSCISCTSAANRRDCETAVTLYHRAAAGVVAKMQDFPDLKIGASSSVTNMPHAEHGGPGCPDLKYHECDLGLTAEHLDIYENLDSPYALEVEEMFRQNQVSLGPEMQGSPLQAELDAVYTDHKYHTWCRANRRYCQASKTEEAESWAATYADSIWLFKYGEADNREELKADLDELDLQTPDGVQVMRMASWNKNNVDSDGLQDSQESKASSEEQSLDAIEDMDLWLANEDAADFAAPSTLPSEAWIRSLSPMPQQQNVTAHGPHSPTCCEQSVEAVPEQQSQTGDGLPSPPNSPLGSASTPPPSSPVRDESPELSLLSETISY